MSDSDQLLLLCLDQRQRWQQGERVLVEAYLEQQPTLLEDSEAVLDLIYNEIVLREESGEQVPLEQYLRRFPQFQAQLQLQFDVHRVLEGDSLTDPGSIEEGECSAAQRSVPHGSAAGYEILEELGRGGMGIVYRAHQVDLKRLVALKMILGGASADPKTQARFRIEAEAVARLQHPNIVQIYEVGAHDGCLFLSLELVDGENLETHFSALPPPPRGAAQLLETLARAMHHAHQRGIIHRDLKPSNVLLTAAGVPKITDFGLAKLVDGEASRTSAEAMIGTPSYMAPEQAAGPAGNLGPHTDVYALGAILYHLLTGRPPCQGATVVATLMQVRSQEPVPPTHLRANLPHELEAICLKCLEKEPSQRYTSALDLAEDLRRFLAGEPIRARPAYAWERALKWVRRRPTAAALVGVSCAAVLGLAGLFLWHSADVETTAELTRSREHQKVDQAQHKYQQFLQGRDDALFYGIYGTIFTDVDVVLNLQATRTTARETLALVGLPVDAEAAPVFDPQWSTAETADVLAGCYQLLLILAEATAQPLPGQTPEDRREQTRQALAILERAARLAPPTAAYHLQRARYLGQLGADNRANSELALAATVQPARMIDYFLLGEERYRQGNVEQASRDFQNALLQQPNDFWSRYFLAVCQLKQRHPAEAHDLLTKCSRQRPGFIWIYLLRGFASEKLNAFPAAEADYHQALQLHPNEDGCYFLHVSRGRMRLQQHKFAEAVDDFTRAIALKPKRCDAYANLARVYQQEKRFARAVQYLDQAIGLHPPAPLLADYQVERGYNLYLDEKYAEAVAACDRALLLRPGYTAAHVLRARVLLHLGRYEEAAQAYNHYLDRGGEAVADIYRGRGLARMKLHNYAGAVDDYTRALQLQPDADIYAHRGWAYFFADAWKLAVRDFEEALRLSPAHADAYIGRGLGRVMMGQYREAVGDADEALRRQPRTPEMMHNIACIFALAVGKVEREPREPGRRILAARFRAQAFAAIRQTLAMLPPGERASFWREKICADPALDSIRNSLEFKQLGKEHGDAKVLR